MFNKKISSILIKENSPSHQDIEFVNSNISGDIRLFIDPVLIEVGKTDFCTKAKLVLDDFFKEFYKAYFIDNDNTRKKDLLSHAKEINDSHMGYANKYGHGNTDDGLMKIFSGVEDYIKRIKISRIFELVLFVPNFAEDGMSDLITNVLYKELSDFTLKICQKYKIKTSMCPDERYYWSYQTHNWEKYTGHSLVVEGKSHLLIPKEIVQKNFKFTVDNYLRSVIVQNICDDAAYYDNTTKKEIRPLAKEKVREQLIQKYGSALEIIKDFSEKNENLLKQYQTIVTNKYSALQLSDNELDVTVYGSKLDT
ncbi:MAG: hypothetical protein E7388_06540 [Ruminococcaceae bacterium]|nr:hypothetical protein [Oscillospiraceae bacterium]